MHVFKLVASTTPDQGHVLQRRECKIDQLGNVIAISYAWGSLPHDQVIPLSDGLVIKLGKEWDAHDFVDELVSLSKDGWLWLDQLSLRQSTATTTELNISIPTVFRQARVLVLLPGADCEARHAIVKDPVSGMVDQRGYDKTSVAIERLFRHAQQCKHQCLGGIDVWLRRVWPWQEFAYANRVRLRFAARARRSSKLPIDTMTLLRQQALDKDKRSRHFLDLLCGVEVAFGEFLVPTGPTILRYMSNYVEQNRTCTKDTDLVSAVAPAIGVTTSANASLEAEVTNLIDYIEKTTRTIYVGPLPRGILESDEMTLRAHPRTFESWATFDAVGKVSFLHGTHFANDDLLGIVDDSITVERFLPNPHQLCGEELPELVDAMALSQRRMMVRWLTSWEPSSSNPGIFDELFQALKENISRVDVTSEKAALLHMRRRVVVNNPYQFMKLSLLLLCVIEDEASDLGDRLVRRCELVKIQNEASSHTAVGYQCRRSHVGKLVAVGDCGLLVDPTDTPDASRVIGRVPFVDPDTLGFRPCSTVRVLQRERKPARSPLVANSASLPTIVGDALHSIRISAVEFVDLSCGHVDDHAAIALSDALMQNTSVKTLLLQNNRIGNSGMDAIDAMLTVNKTLQSVHLPCRYDAVASRRDPHKDDQRLVRWPLVQEANWQQILRVDESGREPTTSVYSDNVAVGDETLLALAEVVTYKSIVTLRLTHMAISDRGISALAAALRKNKTVVSVVLEKNSIGDEGIRALAKALQVNGMIKGIFITENYIGRTGACGLATALKQNTVLSDLNLINNSIDDVSATDIATGLTHNQTLDSLNLRDNCIGDRGAQAIATALSANQNLHTLYLCGNRIGDDGAKATASALSANQNLEYLCLSDNRIGDDGARAFVDALRSTTTLKCVDLNYNKIGKHWATMLKALVDENENLDTIDVDSVVDSDDEE